LEEIQQYPLSLYPAIYIKGKLMCAGRSITLDEAKRCIQDSMGN